MEKCDKCGQALELHTLDDKLVRLVCACEQAKKCYKKSCGAAVTQAELVTGAPTIVKSYRCDEHGFELCPHLCGDGVVGGGDACGRDPVGHVAGALHHHHDEGRQAHREHHRPVQHHQADAVDVHAHHDAAGPEERVEQRRAAHRQRRQGQHGGADGQGPGQHAQDLPLAAGECPGVARESVEEAAHGVLPAGD